MRRRWLLALALASTTAEDEAVAAYVRFAKNTLPRLEKAWAAPHGADAAKQTGRGRALLTWHHRAAAMRRNSTLPWTTLSYETLYEDSPKYFQAVLDVMGLEGDGAAGMEKPVPRCTMDKARLKAREVVRHQGVALPVYLHMFDAATIKRIAMLVGRYLDRSDDFAAPDIKPCMT